MLTYISNEQHEEGMMNAGVVCVVGVERLMGVKKEGTG
jgi:hypothetical protein